MWTNMCLVPYKHFSSEEDQIMKNMEPGIKKSGGKLIPKNLFVNNLKSVSGILYLGKCALSENSGQD